MKYPNVCEFNSLYNTTPTINKNKIYIKTSFRIIKKFAPFSFFYFYQTSHFSTGFILEPGLQLKLSEKSGKFDNGPMTRYFGGEWGSFSICRLIVSSVIAEHQTFEHIFDVIKLSFCVY